MGLRIECQKFIQFQTIQITLSRILHFDGAEIKNERIWTKLLTEQFILLIRSICNGTPIVVIIQIPHPQYPVKLVLVLVFGSGDSGISASLVVVHQVRVLVQIVLVLQRPVHDPRVLFDVVHRLAVEYDTRESVASRQSHPRIGLVPHLSIIVAQVYFLKQERNVKAILQLRILMTPYLFGRPVHFVRPVLLIPMEESLGDQLFVEC